MDNIIKTHFCDINNAGDQLTGIIAKKIWGKNIVYTKPLFCDLVGIGSILDNLCKIPYKSIKYKIKSNIKNLLAYESICHVWSSGFMHRQKDIPLKFYRKKIVFNAVRGKLSKEIIEKIYAPIDNVVLADGGLLSSLIVKNVIKKYNISIIPHWTEINNINILKMLDNYKTANIIDIRNGTEEVITKIANSEIVLSSSLHGLIIADSFNIPNKHIIASSEIGVEQAFKYRDYYSAYDLPHTYINIQKSDIYPSINEITDNYYVEHKKVKEKQEQLIKTFPFK